MVTFGSSSYDDVKFRDGRTVDELRQLIERLPRATGVPNLKEALETAKGVFDQALDRPRAKKFLVVVMDSKSGNQPGEIQQGAKALEEEEIKVGRLGFVNFNHFIPKA